MSTDEGKRQTPMMERYLEVKGQNPGSLLLFRMGDFYELFYDDAQLAARVLGLTLTSRDKASSNPVPMAGFPYHALDNYLQKLIEAGLRVAICEQVEDPKLAKGLVTVVGSLVGLGWSTPVAGPAGRPHHAVGECPRGSAAVVGSFWNHPRAAAADGTRFYPRIPTCSH